MIKDVKVLVVGQTPPPFHGQAINIQRLLDANLANLKLYHVRMAFSSEMDDIGRFQIQKIFHLFSVILRIWWQKFAVNPKIFYFVPAGPNRIPMYRDFVILIGCRWLFDRTIFHFRAGGISELHSRLSRLEKLVFKLAYHAPDLAIRLSEYTPNDHLCVQAKRGIVVNNGMEDHFPRFKDLAARVRASPRRPVLLFVGLLSEEKGVLVTLNACEHLVKLGFDFELRMVGKFQSVQFQEVVVSSIQAKRLDTHISILGVLTGDSKWRQFALADIMVFPTHFSSEAMPMVTIEAAQFSLPVVATIWRGVQTVVVDGKTGFLVPIGDGQAVADKLAVLLDNPALRSKMGRQARDRYKEKFSLERFYRDMNSAFMTLPN